MNTPVEYDRNNAHIGRLESELLESRKVLELEKREASNRLTEARRRYAQEKLTLEAQLAEVTRQRDELLALVKRQQFGMTPSESREWHASASEAIASAEKGAK